MDLSGPVRTLLGGLGLLLLGFLVLHWLVRRAGGWRAVLGRLRRQVALTAVAFTVPVRRWVRYRHRLRRLTRLLRDQQSWRDAEAALRHIAALAAPVGAQPYAVLVGHHEVGVWLVGLDLPEPVEPWSIDVYDSRLWWVERADLAGAEPAAPDTAPMLACLGLYDGYQDGFAVLLDLATGPAVTAFDGDARTGRALLQAVAAQLDARLPVPPDPTTRPVTVARGVHRRFAGPSADDAWRAARGRADGGDPAFAVCAEFPAGPVADGSAARAGLLVAGTPRGHSRLVEAARGGWARVAGTPLVVHVAPLPRAVARAIGTIPPIGPPPGGTASAAGRVGNVSDVDGDRATRDLGVLGRSAAAAPGEEAASRPSDVDGGRPTLRRDDAEPEPPAGTVGVSATSVADAPVPPSTPQPGAP